MLHFTHRGGLKKKPQLWYWKKYIDQTPLTVHIKRWQASFFPVQTLPFMMSGRIVTLPNISTKSHERWCNQYTSIPDYVLGAHPHTAMPTTLSLAMETQHTCPYFMVRYADSSHIMASQAPHAEFSSDWSQSGWGLLLLCGYLGDCRLWGDQWDSEEQENLPLVEEDQAREHFNNLDIHKSMGPDRMLQPVLRELANAIVRLSQSSLKDHGN